MPGITLELAQSNLEAWLAASAAVAASQAYEIDTGNGRRKLTRADAAEVRAMVEFWDNKVKALSSNAFNGRRTRYMVNE